MDLKQQAPTAQSEHAGTLSLPFGGKDSKKLRGYHQRRVYNLLMRGGRYSAADISVALHLSDPRAHIRDLRHKGIPVADEWCRAVHGGRFKRYFIREAGGRLRFAHNAGLFRAGELCDGGEEVRDE